ncbi:toll/interleukin-1 receptor domain-containing protein [Rhodopseudomonas palustris]
MADIAHHKVFISYSWKDKSSAELIRNGILNIGFDTWMDVDEIEPGHSISDAIVKGLKSSDFYLVIISEQSNASSWVRREIATAIELADAKKLTPIPMLLDDAEVPIEFKGLLYIDARKSLQAGIEKLLQYLRAQEETVEQIDRRMIVRKSDDPRIRAQRECQNRLRSLVLGDLRYYMSEKLTISDIQTLWFDLFGRKMEDETAITRVSLCTIELLDRARRENYFPDLLDLICRNYPRFSTLIA